jgi:hypothetical protein
VDESQVRDVPISLKLAFTALLLVWVPIYWRGYGPYNFLWFCDLANFLTLVALWARSPLLLSSQAVSVVVVQTLWSLDVMGRVLTGTHPIGATEYLFDSSLSLVLRVASLFHLLMPPVLIWSLSRMGYDRRGWILQTAIAWIVLPVSYVAVPEGNINFVRGLGDPQTLVPPLVHLLALMVGYPIVLYLPSHLLFRLLIPR